MKILGYIKDNWISVRLSSWCNITVGCSSFCFAYKLKPAGLWWVNMDCYDKEANIFIFKSCLACEVSAFLCQIYYFLLVYFLWDFIKCSVKLKSEIEAPRDEQQTSLYIQSVASVLPTSLLLFSLCSVSTATTSSSPDAFSFTLFTAKCNCALFHRIFFLFSHLAPSFFPSLFSML